MNDIYADELETLAEVCALWEKICSLLTTYDWLPACESRFGVEDHYGNAVGSVGWGDAGSVAFRAANG